MNIFDKGIETLRRQVVCFDMSSILIKPVQRILKYPLMLCELIKVSERSNSVNVIVSRHEDLHRMELKNFYTEPYLIFPSSPNLSAGIHSSRMQSLSMNPAKCERQRVYVIYVKKIIFQSIKKIH